MSNPFLENKWEIYWQLINSAIAGGLVLLGAISAGAINTSTLTAACVAALIVFFTQFRAYWQGQQGEYGKQGSIKLLSFI